MFYPTLFENPNAIYSKDLGKALEWYNTTAIPFSYYDGSDELVVGEDQQTHSTIGPYGHIGGRGRLAGRIFVTHFIITFWDFPKDQIELKKVIKDLSNNPKSNHLDFSDPRWKIEIPFDTSRADDSVPLNVINWGTWEPDENSQVFVSFKDYNGAAPRSAEELRQEHILSPIEKEKNRSLKNRKGVGSDKTSWDSDRNIKVRQSELTSESLSDKYYPTLFENPNAIYLPKVNIAVDWSQVRTMPFSYYNTLMYVGSGRMTHIILYGNLGVKDPIAEKRSGRGKYAGRLYVSSKVITFWEFPEDKEILDQVLKDIEEETSIRFDNTWTVEIPSTANDNWWKNWHPGRYSQTFVPINRYVTGPKRSEEELQQNHVQNPIEKEKEKKLKPIPKGFGSDKTSWDSPRNIKVRQSELTSESIKK